MRIAATPPPLTPDGDEAREWAERELSRPVYAEAEPTPIDRVARAIGDFFASLFGAEAPPGLATIILLTAAALVLVAIVVAFVVWGRPRLVRRAQTPVGALFGDDDQRTARQLRELAEQAAAGEDWDEAIVLRFRALARSLVERGVVDLPPGATARTLADLGAASHPDHAQDLRRSAASFDDVRYLGRHGTASSYADVARTDQGILAASAARSRVPA